MHRLSGGTLLIQFEPEGSLLKCIIEDNGVGRKKAIELETHTLTPHASLSERITLDRIDLLNRIYSTTTYSIRTIDLTDGHEIPCGTRVEFRLPMTSIYSSPEI